MFLRMAARGIKIMPEHIPFDGEKQYLTKKPREGLFPGRRRLFSRGGLPFKPRYVPEFFVERGRSFLYN
jgi:hypothetical protein